MANPTWPSTLPNPLSSGAQVAPAVDNVITSSVETGAPKRRRRFTWVPDRITVSLSLTGAQVTTLNTFVRTTLADVLPFDWVDPVTQGAKTWVFTKRPSYTADAGMYDSWTASVELESKP